MSEHPELTAIEGGVQLTVHVQPGAGRPEVIGRHGDALKVRVASPPTGSRANDAVLELVTREFAVEHDSVTVASGESSQHKQLKLDGVELRAAEKVVERLLAPPPGARR